jgi:hypothetical protein
MSDRLRPNCGAPTISQRKRATASAWSFGVSNGDFGNDVSMEGSSWRQRTMRSPALRRTLPQNRSLANGLRMVGPNEPAPRRQWTSGHMRRSQEGA